MLAPNKGITSGFELFDRPTNQLTASQQRAAGELGVFGFLPETDLSVGSTLNQVFQGFLSGFTGFDIGADPQNSVEAIARSIGGVAGFVGYVPNPSGLAGRLGGATLARAVGATRLASHFASAPTGFAVRSIPLFAADTIIETAGKFAKSAAFSESLKFLNVSAKTGDALREGARLGLASAFAGPWTQGIDEIAINFGLGAIEGGGFQFLNNATRTAVGKMITSGTERDRAIAEGSVRVLANVLYEVGLQEGFNKGFFDYDAPLEVDVFHYLMAAYFGIRDLPYAQKKAQEYLHRKSPVEMLNLKKFDDYHALDPEVREEVDFQVDARVGRALNTKGDTEGAGILSRAFAEIYNESFNNRYNELINNGETDADAFRSANDYAREETGVRFWNHQQEVVYQQLGSGIRDFFSERGRPEVYIRSNPSGGERPVVLEGDAPGRLHIDTDQLQRRFEESGETDPVKFRDREILTEYFRQTSAEDVDVGRLVDETLATFAREPQRTPTLSEVDFTKYDPELGARIETRLKELYPEIDLKYTNEPIAYVAGSEVFNQTVSARINFILKSQDILSSEKATQVFEKGAKNNWTLEKTLTELQIPKVQKKWILKNAPDAKIPEEVSRAVASGMYEQVGVVTARDASGKPTSDYGPGSRYDVTGGLVSGRYREFRIALPSGVNVSRKGHADFAAPNDIGWVRADEVRRSDGVAVQRIFEFQSDLFQKGIAKDDPGVVKAMEKDWTRFFIKSLIQSAAKKGFSEIHFPKGDTVERIEGFDEFRHGGDYQRVYDINDIQDSIDVFERLLRQINEYPDSVGASVRIREGTQGGSVGTVTVEYWNEATQRMATKYFTVSNLDIAHYGIKEEVSSREFLPVVKELISKRIERERVNINEIESQYGQPVGLPKYAQSVVEFYDKTVRNILEKDYGKESIETHLDEDGFEWFKLNLSTERDLNPILLQKNEYDQIIGQANTKAMSVLIDAVNQRQDTLPHEYAHHYISWFRDSSIVQNAIKKWGSEEKLVQSIGEQAVRQKGEVWGWWKKFTKWILNKFRGASKEDLSNLLTDAFLERRDISTVEVGGGKPKYVSSFRGVKTEELPVDLSSIEVARKSALSTDYIARNFAGHEQATSDHDLPSILANPLQEFSEGIRSSLPDIDEADIRSLVFGAFSREGQTWEGAVSEVLRGLSERAGEALVLDGNHPTRRALRKAWKTWEASTGTRQAYWDGSSIKYYGNDGFGQLDGTGKRIARSKAPTHLDSALKRIGRTEGFVVEKVEKQGADGRVRSIPIFEDPDFNARQYLIESYRANKPVFAGTKDKGRIHHMEGFLFDKSEAPKLFREKMAAIEATIARLNEGRDPKKRIQSVDNVLEPLMADVPREVHEALMLNNIKLLEELNGGIPFERMLELNETGRGHFLMRPNDLNKRMQLLDDGSPTADRTFYPEETQTLDGVRAVVVDDVGFMGEGVEQIKLPRYGPDGKTIEQYVAEHHTDGAVFERQDVFDARLRDIGGDPGAGVIKGTTVFATPGEGMFLGKMAIFRAPDEMNAQMMSHGAGIHQIYMSSAAKQRGIRSQYNLYVKKDGSIQFENTETGRHRAIGAENIKTFVVPFSGQRLNLSVGEDIKKALTDQPAPKQLHTTLEDPEAIRHWVETYTEPSYYGGDRANRDYWHNIADPTADVSKTNVDKIGIPEIVKLFDGEGKDVIVDSLLYRKIAEHIMRTEKEDAQKLEADEEHDHEDLEFIDSLQDFTSAADRILKLWDLTPATIEHPYVKPYFEAALKNYIRKRVMRPKMPYSGKVVAGPADPFLRRKLDVKPGYLYLDEAWKSKKISWLDGKETTLGKAYEQYQSATDPGVKRRMKEKLMFATIRVPSDSAGGTRMLELGGFTGRRGAGGTVHNEEMIYLGGMDLDHDTFYVIQDIDRGGTADGKRPISEFFSRHRYQFNVDGDPKKPIIDSKPKENDRYWMKPLEPHERHPLSTADPSLLMAASKGAYEGNNLLGIPAVAGRRKAAWWERAKAGDPEALEVEVTESVRKRAATLLGIDPKSDVRITLVPARSDHAYDMGRRESVNRTADAGNVTSLRQSKFTVGPFMAKDLLSAVKVEYTEPGKKKVTRTLGDEAMREAFSPTASRLWKRMQKADYYASGRNYGGEFTIEEGWNALRRSLHGTVQLPAKIPGTPRDRERLYITDDLARALAPEVQRLTRREDLTSEVLSRRLAKVGREQPTKPYTLSQIFQGLSRLSDGLDLQNTYYQSLRLLASNPYVRNTEVPKFVNERGMRKLTETFNKIFNADTPDAELMRRLIGREAINLPDVENYNGWNLSQDLADLTSARVVGDASLNAFKNGEDVGTLMSIAQDAEDLKALQNDALKGGGGDGDALTLDDVRTLSEEIASNLNKDQKRFFDMYMLGSLFKQDNAWKTIENRMREDAKADGWSDDKLQRELKNAQKDWWKTNQQKFAYGLEIIDPASVAEFGKRYNEIVQATHRENLTENEVRALMNRAQVDEAPALEETLPGASTLNEAPEIERFSDSFMERIWSLSETAEREKIFEGKRGKENLKRMRELKDIIRRNPNVRTHFADMFASVTSKAYQQRGGIGVSPSRATLEDLDVFIRFMKDADRGSLLGGIARGKKVPSWAYRVFPEYMAKMMEPIDSIPTKRLQRVITEDGVRDVEIYDFNSTLGTVKNFFDVALDAMEAENAAVVERLANRYRYVRNAVGADADRMIEATVAKMELDAERGRKDKNEAAIEVLEKEWKRHEKDYEELKGKRYLASFQGEPRRQVTGQELMDRITRDHETHTREDLKRYVKNIEAEEQFLARRDDGSVDPKESVKRITRHIERTRKIPQFGLNGLYKIIYEIELGSRQTRRVIDGQEQLISADEARERGYHPNFVNDIAREIREKDRERRGNDSEDFIGEVKYGYWPRMGHPEKIVREYMIKKLEEAKKNGSSEEELRRIESRIRKAYGEGTLKDDDLVGDMQDIIMGGGIRGEESTRFAPLRLRPGSTLGRSDEPIPQWDKSLRALEMYGMKMSSAYHKMVAALVSDYAIRNFERREPMGDTTKSWARYIRQYVSRSVGHPSIFPQEFLDDKDLSLRNSKWWYFTDHALENGFRKLDRVLGHRLLKDHKSQKIGDPGSLSFQRKAAWWSNLNAKYELLALLARSKSGFNNLTQISNTFVNVGSNASMKAMSLKWMRENILDDDGNAMFHGWDDVRRFVEAAGGIESFVVDDGGLKANVGAAKWGAFVGEVKQHLSKAWREGKDANDKTLWEIARKYDIGENIVRAGAWFMRASERRVRMHSFMAHYIHNRSVYEVNGSTHSVNDPLLIEMARRGVRATQFMYNNASRPAFAASSFGKVAARFNLWAWNSVRFQKDVYQQAKLFGFRKGTPEFDRLQRMATYDLMAFALASIFPASIFEATLPQPMGWLLDVSDFFFGESSEDRESAFFGTLPYPLNPAQVIMPPSSRYITSFIKPLVTGDWERFASYHVWSMFPFGLAARDVKGTIQNPIRAVENTTGFPLIRLHQELKNREAGNNPPSFF